MVTKTHTNNHTVCVDDSEQNVWSSKFDSTQNIQNALFSLVILHIRGGVTRNIPSEMCHVRILEWFLMPFIEPIGRDKLQLDYTSILKLST